MNFASLMRLTAGRRGSNRKGRERERVITREAAREEKWKGRREEGKEGVF